MSQRLWMIPALLVFVLNSAQAAYRIDDPNQIIPEANAFIGELVFANSFKVGDQMTGESRFCKISNGKETCFPPVFITSTVKQVQADKAIMLTVSSEDEEGTDWVVTREVFEKVKGNFIVLYLVTGLGGDKPKEMDFAVIESRTLVEHVLANGTKIPAFTAAITQNIWQEKTQTYLQKKVALTIGKGLPAVSQLLQVQPDPGVLKTPVFKVTQFKAALE